MEFKEKDYNPTFSERAPEDKRETREKSKAEEEMERKDLKKQKEDIQKNAGFYSLAAMVILGIISILLISVYSAIKRLSIGSFWSVFSLSLVIALAAALCGGFLGFLFGIPRSVQRKSRENTNGDKDNASREEERAYTNNTNLEEISDWLTKIIVGVSLTQLPAIGRQFNLLTINTAAGFQTYLDHSLINPYAGALIIFFSVCGFFAVYLWSRIYLFAILTKLDRELFTRAEIDKRVDEQVDKQLKSVVSGVDTKINEQQKQIVDSLTKERWLTRKREFERQRDLIAVAENAPNVRPIVDVAKPGPVTIYDDCQQKRWGESKTADGFEVVAEFSGDSIESYAVTLIVKPVSPGSENKLRDNVYFFMHDTFFPDIVVIRPVENNMASYYFTSYAAFTVGIALNGGTTKLEINLNREPNAPAGYRYNEEEELFSFDRIKEELKKFDA